jgi:hypothetical protein
MGPEAFDAALQEACVQPAPLDEDANEADEKEEENDPLQIIIQNTYDVLKKVPEKRGEWWYALRKFRVQASQEGQVEMAVFAEALMSVVEGAPPQSLTEQIPQPFLPAWKELINQLSEEEPHDGSSA